MLGTPFGFGINGSTISQNASDTFPDFMLIYLASLVKIIEKRQYESNFVYMDKF